MWLELKDAQGNIVTTGMKKQGEAETLDVKAPATLVVGAVNGLSMLIDGKPYDIASMQSKGNVSRITID